MSVAVAHQVSPVSHLALAEGGREAALRQTDLAVIHVVESLDMDIAEATRRGLGDQLEPALTMAGVPDVTWEVHLSTGEQDVSEAVLKIAADVNAELLVIGARRRSPVGKFLLGSVAQSIILDAKMPVLVVKPEA